MLNASYCSFFIPEKNRIINGETYKLIPEDPRAVCGGKEKSIGAKKMAFGQEFFFAEFVLCVHRLSLTPTNCLRV